VPTIWQGTGELMKRRILVLFIVLATLFSTLYIFNFTAYADTELVYLGGMPAGFVLNNKGATVIGVNDVITKDGIFSPSKEADIKAGDLLLSIDGKEINTALDIENALEGYDNCGATAVIDRDGEIIIKIVFPAKDLSGKYRLGLFVRDNVTGIGTITYVKKDGTFGALGHPVVEGCYQRIIKIDSGNAFKCNIIGVNKGEKGKAGEIRGYFIEDEPLGEIYKNTEEGLFGKITCKGFADGLIECPLGEPVPGKASIYSTVDGTTPCEYSVSIVKVDKKTSDNKQIVIKITDESLLNKTNGILQGMSGSPIVQNGKIVGAVTHVFLNDPTRGFGITINKMINS